MKYFVLAESSQVKRPYVVGGPFDSEDAAHHRLVEYITERGTQIQPRAVKALGATHRFHDENGFEASVWYARFPFSRTSELVDFLLASQRFSSGTATEDDHELLAQTHDILRRHAESTPRGHVDTASIFENQKPKGA